MALIDCIIEKVSSPAIRKSLVDAYDSGGEAGLQNAFNDQLKTTKGKIFGEKISEAKFVDLENALKPGIEKAKALKKDLINTITAKKGRAPNEKEMRKIIKKVRKEYNPADDLKDLYGHSDVRNKLQTTDLVQDIHAIEQILMREIVETMEHTRSHVYGSSRNKKDTEDVIRGMYSKKSPDYKPSKDIAKYTTELQNMLEKARVLLNKVAGMDLVGKIMDFVPTFDDIAKFTPDNFDRWYKDAGRLIDVQSVVKTIRDGDDLLKLTRAEQLDHPRVLEAFTEIYEAKGSGGTAKLNFGKTDGTVAPGRLTGERILTFENGDNHLEYLKIWGPKDLDIMNSIYGYVEGISREIASINKFGVNPERNIGKIADYAELKSWELGMGKIPEAKDKALTIYEHAMGNMYTSGNMYAKLITAGRQYELTHLGKSTLTSAPTDVLNMAVAGAASDVSQIRMLTEFIKSAIFNKGARQEAIKLMVSAQYAQGVTKSAARYMESSSWGAINKVSSAIVRITGMNYLTYTAKMVYQKELLQRLADSVVRGDSYKAVDEAMTQFLSRNGITEDIWKGISSKGTTKTERGLQVIDPNKLDFSEQQKLMAAISGDTQFAIVEPTARTRAFAYGKDKAGTPGGEARRALWQFRSHPLSHFMLNMARGYNMKGLQRMQYLGTSVIGLTGVGAAINMTYDFVVEGKTPRTDFDKWDFYLSALRRGGGLGLIGDAVFSSISTYKGVSGFIAGPLISDLDRWQVYLTGSYDEIRDLEIARTAGRIGIEIIDKTVASLWYTRLAVNRGILDAARRANDDEWEYNQRTLDEKDYEEKGQSYKGPKHY